MAVPHYDQGAALNMVIMLQPEPAAFDPEKFPEWFWVSSLFGRVTHNLVLRDELKQAYEIVERELKVVADIQRSLLPQVCPRSRRSSWRRTTTRRSGPAAIITTSSRCRTGAGAS